MELVAVMKRALSPLYEEILHAYHNHLELLAVVGALYTAQKGLYLLCGCYRAIRFHISIRMFSKTFLARQYGGWAVVTGATDGIGKAYAEELASFGINIILISRNRDKLQMVSESIATTYGVKTSFIVADFNKGREVFPAIKEALKDVDVGILVNNAGVCYEYPQYVTDVPEDKIWEIINVNIAATTMMLHIVLPGMVQRKKGAIINVTSASARVTCPQFTIYAASKTYLDNLTEALYHEYSSKGIFIQSLTPFFVVTNISISMSTFFKRKSILVPLAKDIAYQAVRTIGLCRRTTGSYAHSLQKVNWYMGAVKINVDYELESWFVEFQAVEECNQLHLPLEK
ncbi:inactive hydroxysteroid dehydrogenase-like protein 1 [Pelobates fuscus]|uniref:inactive hydroxysteroid dehydrogenase-like protein 1 n=1 Tax=Pelobates fuscus TaxID=191477 RepID=UPI002FE486BF